MSEVAKKLDDFLLDQPEAEGNESKKDEADSPSSPAEDGSKEDDKKTDAMKNENDKKNFSESYDLGEELGVGAFSSVRLGTHKKTKESFAVKVITKAAMQEFDKATLKDEIAVLNILRHDSIIRLYGVFDEKDYIYLITEKVMGGMLFDRLVEKIAYNERDAMDVCKIVLDALEYCHKNRVAHRDLKAENILLISKDDNSSLKIADFGFAKQCTGPKSLKTQCGSPRHVAPEILENVPYDTQVDMWSLGVIMYTLLVGYPPFYEETNKALFRKIRKGEYEFEEEYWGGISKEAKDLVRSLLVVDPDTRDNASEALMNPWISGKKGLDLSSKDLSKSIYRLRSFRAKEKLKGAIYAVMATRKLNSLGLNLLEDLAL